MLDALQPQLFGQPLPGTALGTPIVWVFLACKKTLLPASVFSEPVKASCNVLELISQTVSSLLKVNDLSPTGNLRVATKFGLDGSGSH